jgi:hypothetical protein
VRSSQHANTLSSGKLPNYEGLLLKDSRCKPWQYHGSPQKRWRLGAAGNGQDAMSKRSCGACSLCCKLSYIRELNKPIDSWCPHARPGNGGCSIYPDRPLSCQAFVCGWLGGTLGLGDEWFPARCKMIISPRVPGQNLAEQGFLITVDPAHPNAWRRKPHYEQLLALARQTFVVIRIGRRQIGLNADGSEEEVIKTQASIEGRDEPV